VREGQDATLDRQWSASRVADRRDAETVYIYQPGRPAETRRGILKVAGTGPVKGFTLQLRTTWDGLK